MELRLKVVKGVIGTKTAEQRDKKMNKKTGSMLTLLRKICSLGEDRDEPEELSTLDLQE